MKFPIHFASWKRPRRIVFTDHAQTGAIPLAARWWGRPGTCITNEAS